MKKTMTKTVWVVAVMCSALFGIWLRHEIMRQRPTEPPKVSKSPDMRVTMQFQASFDGSNWFALTNLSYGPVTVTNLADFDITRNIHYIGTVAR